MSYVNHSSCLFVGIFFPVLGAVAVGTRFLVRHYRKQELLLDDWFALVGLVLTIGVCTCFAIGAAHDTFGSHFNPLANAKLGQTTEQWILLRKLQFAMTVVRDPAIGFIKLSILYFYERVFSKGSGRTFKIVNNGFIILICGWMIAYLLTCFLQCKTDLELQWDLPGPHAKSTAICFDRMAWNLSSAVTDVIFDVCIIIIPIPIIWSLSMPMGKKVATQFVFLAGTFAVALSIIRMVVQIQFNGKGDVLGIDHKDTVASISIVRFWTTVEVGVAQVVCCLPSLWTLVERPGRIVGILRTVISRSSIRTDSEDENHDRREDVSWPPEERGRRTGSREDRQDLLDNRMMREAGLAIVHTGDKGGGFAGQAV